MRPTSSPIFVFLHMLKSIPPLDELFRTAGLQLPNYLGEKIKQELAATKEGNPEEALDNEVE